MGEIVDDTLVTRVDDIDAICPRCKFYGKSLRFCMDIKCSPSTRPDGEWIYFKPLDPA